MLSQEDQVTEERSRKKAEHAMEMLMAEELGQDPPEVDPPVTDPPADPPEVDPPVTDPPVDGPPVTDPPPTDPPPTDPPPTDPPPTDPPPTDPPPPTDDADPAAILAEIEKVEIKPGERPATKRIVKTIKEASKKLFTRYQTEAQRAEQLAKDLETQKQQEVLTPEIKAEIEEHRKFRSIFDYKNTPEFKQQFVEKRNALEQNVVGVLTDPSLPAQHVMPKGTLEYLQRLGNGSILEFATSSRPMPADTTVRGQKIPLGEDGKPMTQEEFFDKYIAPSMNRGQKAALEQFVGQSVQLKAAERRELENAETKAAEILEQRKKEAQEYQEKFRQEAAATATEWVEQNAEFGKKLDVPPTATPEERARIEAHNKLIEKAEMHVKQTGGDMSPRTRMRTLLNDAAMLTTVPVVMKTLKETIAAKDKEIAELKSTIHRIKNAGKTKNLGQTGVKPTPPPAKKEDPETMMARQQEEYLRQNQA